MQNQQPCYRDWTVPSAPSFTPPLVPPPSTDLHAHWSNDKHITIYGPLPVAVKNRDPPPAAIPIFAQCARRQQKRTGFRNLCAESPCVRPAHISRLIGLCVRLCRPFCLRRPAGGSGGGRQKRRDSTFPRTGDGELFTPITTVRR